MNFTESILVDAPVQIAFDIFAKTENKHHWHDDLVEIESVSGATGEVGSVTCLRFKQFDLIETIAEKDPPNQIIGEYLAEGICWNSMRSSFTEVSPNQTRFETEVTYKIYSWMMKVMAFVMPGMLRNQVRLTLIKYKAFVESQND